MSFVSHISPTEELAAFLARGPTPDAIAAFRLSDSALERARELMDKTKNGTLTPEESRELDRLILLDDIIALIQLHVPATEINQTADNGDGLYKAPGA
jgi:hypothetical protein